MSLTSPTQSYSCTLPLQGVRSLHEKLLELSAERALSPFLQQSRHEQQVLDDDDFSIQQQPWLRSPIQCTEAADVEAINFSIDEVNFVREKSELVCNNYK